jgi:hypothetical protein
VIVPGGLALSGRGARSLAEGVPAAGEVKLTIPSQGQKKRRLNRTGQVKVMANVTYTPSGGSLIDTRLGLILMA